MLELALAPETTGQETGRGMDRHPCREIQLSAIPIAWRSLTPYTLASCLRKGGELPVPGGMQAATEEQLLGEQQGFLMQGQGKGLDPEPRVPIVWATAQQPCDPKGLTACSKYSMTSNNCPVAVPPRSLWSKGGQSQLPDKTEVLISTCSQLPSTPHVSGFQIAFRP